ncbi:MAG: hypothetical protein CMJ31_02525 [Phycisphaerae bacterium]|nr:hypothetical protein [Phycisphaerae bacterium]|tara:strand:+ start:311 stop:526 length:216 start_codon:yes stop_codon:yes gene_type:complete
MTQINDATAPIPATQELPPQEAERSGSGRAARWGAKYGARIGAAAFMFFLIKGLLWLIIPAGIAAVAFIRG